MQILVFHNGERFHYKAVRVIVAAGSVQQPARSNKTSHCQAAFPDNHLSGIGIDPVRVLVEIAFYTVNFHRLINIPANHPVVISFFRQVFVIIKGTLIGKEKRAFDVAFDGILIGGQREEQFMKRFTCDLASTGLFCAISCESASIRLLPLSKTYIFCRCASAKL